MNFYPRLVTANFLIFYDLSTHKIKLDFTASLEVGC